MIAVVSRTSSSTAWRAATSSRSASSRPASRSWVSELGRIRTVALGRRAQRLDEILVAGLDLLGGDDRGQDRLAPQGAGRVGLGVVGEGLLVLAGDLQIHLLRDALAGQRVHRLVDDLVRSRVHELVRQLNRRLVGGGLQDGLLELALDRGLVGLPQPGGDVVAQLLQRVKAAGLGGELVIELGEQLGLDLRDGDLEDRVLLTEIVGVALGEGHRHLAGVAGRGAGELILEAGDQTSGAQLDQLVAALATLERARRRRCPRNP